MFTNDLSLCSVAIVLVQSYTDQRSQENQQENQQEAPASEADVVQAAPRVPGLMAPVIQHVVDRCVLVALASYPQLLLALIALLLLVAPTSLIALSLDVYHTLSYPLSPCSLPKFLALLEDSASEGGPQCLTQWYPTSSSIFLAICVFSPTACRQCSNTTPPVGVLSHRPSAPRA
jgi:hypothetical protein